MAQIERTIFMLNYGPKVTIWNAISNTLTHEYKILEMNMLYHIYYLPPFISSLNIGETNKDKRKNTVQIPIKCAAEIIYKTLVRIGLKD